MKRILISLLFISISALTISASPMDTWQYWTGESTDGWVDANAQFGYRNQMGYSDGSLHRIYSPEIIRYSDYRAWGHYTSANGTRIIGSFGYSYSGESGRRFVQNRNPYSGIPFLLADSSISGGTMQRFTGYASLENDYLDGKITAGVNFRYGIDDGYRNIFPKSESRHADRQVGISGVYHFQNDRALRYDLSRFVFQEMLITSKYQLDQNLSPVFYKISGLDYPIILRGSTSAQRLQVHSGWLQMLTFNSPRIHLSAGTELGSGSAEDGGAYRDPQGEWTSQRLLASADLKLNSLLSVSGSGEQTKLQANHPDFDLEIYQFEQRIMQVELMFKPLKQIEVRAGFGSEAMLRSDTFIGIQDYFRTNFSDVSGKIDLMLFDCANLSITARGGYSEPVTSNVQWVDDTGWYYSEFTLMDELFWQYRFSYFQPGFSLDIPAGRFTMKLSAEYQQLSSPDTEDRRQSVVLNLTLSTNE